MWVSDMDKKENRDFAQTLADALNHKKREFSTKSFSSSGTSSSKTDATTTSDKPPTCASCSGCRNTECHGCGGKGWVENSMGDVKRCPVCHGKGEIDSAMIYVDVDNYHPGLVTGDDIKPIVYYVTFST